MDNIIYLTNLYDLYKELIDEKKREYFESYYFDNLSLQEISENTGFSRNAIHKHIKSTEDLIIFYEEKLKLYQKKDLLKKIINDIEDKKIKERLEEISW